MNEPDAKLRALLKHWRDVEPPGSFEQDVWRRIRLTAAREPKRSLPGGWWPRLLWQPAFPVAAAVAIAVAIGAWNGARSTPPLATQHAEIGFLSSGTLAGGYAQLTGRGTR